MLSLYTIVHDPKFQSTGSMKVGREMASIVINLAFLFYVQDFVPMFLGFYSNSGTKS